MISYRAKDTPYINRTRSQAAELAFELRKKLSLCAPLLGRMAVHFSLLAGETRLKILTLLDNAGELCVCDLASILGMSPAAVSQHLSRMRSGGLVESRRDGMTIFYRRTKTSGEACPEFPQFRPQTPPEKNLPVEP